MLIQTERIITQNEYNYFGDPEKLIEITKRELVQELVNKLNESEKVKVVITNEMSNSFGIIMRIRASIRVYNPDE